MIGSTIFYRKINATEDIMAQHWQRLAYTINGIIAFWVCLIFALSFASLHITRIMPFKAFCDTFCVRIMRYTHHHSAHTRMSEWVSECMWMYSVEILVNCPFDDHFSIFPSSFFFLLAFSFIIFHFRFDSITIWNCVAQIMDKIFHFVLVFRWHMCDGTRIGYAFYFSSFSFNLIL